MGQGPILPKPTLANFSVSVFWPNFPHLFWVWRCVVMVVVVVVGLDCPGPPSARPPLRCRTAQNFALFFPSPATIFILFSLSCWFFR